MCHSGSSRMIPCERESRRCMLMTRSLYFCLFFFSLSETKAAMNLFRKNAITTKKEKEQEIQYEEPPDGGWGWMVVLHCFLVSLSSGTSFLMCRFPFGQCFQTFLFSSLSCLWFPEASYVFLCVVCLCRSTS